LPSARCRPCSTSWTGSGPPPAGAWEPGLSARNGTRSASKFLGCFHPIRVYTINMPKYSIVVPCNNEEENVTILYARLKQVMEQVGESFELVLVDDGSSDQTYRLLEEIAAVDSRVLVVKLRRNFGQTSALAAGFDHASGEFILAMDGDLQHDPNDIPLFLEKLAEGYDVVSGWRKQRVDNFVLRRIPSGCANWLMVRLSGVPIHAFGTTFQG